MTTAAQEANRRKRYHDVYSCTHPGCVNRGEDFVCENDTWCEECGQPMYYVGTFVAPAPSRKGARS